MGNMLQTAATSAPSLTTEGDWGQQTRQLLARSNACALLANGADEAEIAAALSDLAPQLREAVAGHARECSALADLPSDVLEKVVSDEIGGFVRLTGGGWMPEHRQEFIDQCCIEFALLPASVIIPAIRIARRKVFDPKRFVSWIFEYVEKDLNRLEAEGERLMQLARIAGI